MQLTLFEFENRYGVLRAPDGELYHTTLPTPEQCTPLLATGRLCTAVDDDDNTYLVRGIHIVNAWAYWITEHPVPEAVTEVTF